MLTVQGHIVVLVAAQVGTRLAKERADCAVLRSIGARVDSRAEGTQHERHWHLCPGHYERELAGKLALDLVAAVARPPDTPGVQ